MKQLLLMRHGKAERHDYGTQDRKRSLMEKGRKATGKVIKELISRGFIPDLIVSSPAVRAMETAGIAEDALQTGQKIKIVPELYNGGPDDFIPVLINLPDEIDTVLITAHYPGLPELTQKITGKWIDMKTSDIVVIHLECSTWDQFNKRTTGSIVCHLMKR